MLLEKKEGDSMYTVNEVAKISGVSVSTLQRWDRLKLLCPRRNSLGYREYTDEDLEKLQQILIFKELHISLEEVKKYFDGSTKLSASDVLEQQIYLLEKEKEHLDNLISFARIAKSIGVKWFSFEAFKPREYIDTFVTNLYKDERYKKVIQQTEHMSFNDAINMRAEYESIFQEFGRAREKEYSDNHIQEILSCFVEWMEKYFTACTPDVIFGLYAALSSDGDAAKDVDLIAGEGTAVFVAEIFFNKYTEELVERMVPIGEQFEALQGQEIESDEVRSAVDKLDECMQSFFGKNNSNYIELVTSFIEEIFSDSEDKQIGEFISKAFKYYL